MSPFLVFAASQAWEGQARRRCTGTASPSRAMQTMTMTMILRTMTRERKGELLSMCLSRAPEISRSKAMQVETEEPQTLKATTRLPQIRRLPAEDDPLLIPPMSALAEPTASPMARAQGRATNANKTQHRQLLGVLAPRIRTSLWLRRMQSGDLARWPAAVIPVQKRLTPGPLCCHAVPGARQIPLQLLPAARTTSRILPRHQARLKMRARTLRAMMARPMRAPTLALFPRRIRLLLPLCALIFLTVLRKASGARERGLRA